MIARRTIFMMFLATMIMATPFVLEFFAPLEDATDGLYFICGGGLFGLLVLGINFASTFVPKKKDEEE